MQKKFLASYLFFYYVNCRKFWDIMKIFSEIALIIFIVISSSTLLGGTSSKDIVATRTSVPPKIDGYLDEPQWKRSVPVSGFQQFDPVEGAAPTEETLVYVLYDDRALYIGVECKDRNPSEIVYQLTRRDRTAQSDRFSIMIDSYHDHSTAYYFSGTVSGVKTDGLLSHDGLVYDIQWDAVWDFAAQIVDDGWSAEFLIPYSALRFARQEGEYVWGINFRRYIARKKETDEWVMVPRSETPAGTLSIVSKIGNLTGMVDIMPPLHLEIFPYHVSKLSFLTQEPFKTRGEYNANFGLDLKYGLTNNFTLDMAVNPDFGQVEVDQAYLNLTVFETFFPEKRPFFLEGSQIFSFGNSFDNTELRLLYPRRIGRRPSGYNTLYNYDTLYVGSNARFSKKPEITTILGAGKLSGRTSNGLEVGVMTAVTDRERAEIEGVDGTKSPLITVEPRASYNVFRVKQELWSNSTIGSLISGSFKDGELPSLSGGLDWKLRFNGNLYGIDGYIAGSRAAFYSENPKEGLAGRMALGKLGGKHWVVFSAYDFSTKNFYIDDLGFYSQPREHGGYLAVAYKEDHPSDLFLRYGVVLQTDHRWNWNGNKTKSQIEIEPAFEFKNFWQLKMNYFHYFRGYDDENRGIIGLYRRPSGNALNVLVRTDARKPLQLSLLTIISVYENKSKNYTARLQPIIRPLTWIELQPGITYMHTVNEEAWATYYYVDQYDTIRYGFREGYKNLFGDRDVDYLDISLRGTITFTPTISLQFFNQILFAKWRYDNLKKLVAPVEFGSAIGNLHDFFNKIFNANLVFRWEYLPGSTFYLVWTQNRQGYTGLYDQNLFDDISDVFKVPMDNVILAKISYWWSL